MKTKDDFPLGVSGIMRCRDHADFLELCIESCIHALYELVVVYHDSTDGTVEILKQIHKKYPLNVRDYEYTDYLFPISITHEMYEYVARTDEVTPNLFHNYCNFALSKARFRFVVKIDADHICFLKRLKQICDAYRSTKVERITEGEISAMDAYRCGKLDDTGYSSYMTCILRRIANDKASVAFSGINVFVDKGTLKVCLGANDDNNFYPLFNGVHDHFFFTNTGEPQFVKYLSQCNPIEKNRVLELLPCKDLILDGGFLWYHVKNLMGQDYKDSVGIMSARPELFEPIAKLHNTPFKDFVAHYHPVVPFAQTRGIYRMLFDSSKPFIEKDLEDLILIAFNNSNRNKRMNTEKYTSEFYDEVNSVVNQYIDRFSHLMSFGGADMAEAVGMLLKQHCYHEVDHFVRCRLAGKTVEESFNRLIRCFDLFTDKSIPVFSNYRQKPKVIAHPWEEALREYEGSIIIHIHNENQVGKIQCLNVPDNVNVIILSDTEITDEIELPDNFAMLTLEWSSEKAFENQFLETNFPYVYHCANAIEWIIRILHPSCMKSLADASVSGCIVDSLAIIHGFIYE